MLEMKDDGDNGLLTSDVDDLEPGEGEDGEVLHLGLVGTPHEQHLLLQTCNNTTPRVNTAS